MGIYYTIQTLEGWKSAQELGYLQGNPENADHDYIQYYPWMIEQMNKRINHDNSYPIWLWVKKPDIRQSGHLSKRTEGVRLTVKIDDNKVLLSDFEAWHYVLNNWFLPISWEEDRLFKEGKLSITKEESWERIFDINLLNNSELWTVEKVLQGVTGRIDLKDVIKVDYFKAR